MYSGGPIEAAPHVEGIYVGELTAKTENARGYSYVVDAPSYESMKAKLYEYVGRKTLDGK
jgi:hypothetical protein